MKRILMIAVSLLALYIGGYAMLYAHRSPAANLMYFVYSKDGSFWASHEEAIYRFYYPLYRVHHLLGGMRHNFDRPELVIDDL